MGGYGGFYLPHPDRRHRPSEGDKRFGMRAFIFGAVYLGVAILCFIVGDDAGDSIFGLVYLALAMFQFWIAHRNEYGYTIKKAKAPKGVKGRKKLVDDNKHSAVRLRIWPFKKRGDKRGI